MQMSAAWSFKWLSWFPGTLWPRHLSKVCVHLESQGCAAPANADTTFSVWGVPGSWPYNSKVHWSPEPRPAAANQACQGRGKAMCFLAHWILKIWPRNPCMTECLTFLCMCANVCHFCLLQGLNCCFNPLLAAICGKGQKFPSHRQGCTSILVWVGHPASTAHTGSVQAASSCTMSFWALRVMCVYTVMLPLFTLAPWCGKAVMQFLMQFQSQQPLAFLETPPFKGELLAFRISPLLPSNLVLPTLLQCLGCLIYSYTIFLLC